MGFSHGFEVTLDLTSLGVERKNCMKGGDWEVQQSLSGKYSGE